MRTDERLRALSTEIAALQTEISILDEQIAFQSEVAEDARIRALVSETPIADREAREAAGDLQRLVHSRAELVERQRVMREQQDQLLERLLEEKR